MVQEFHMECSECGAALVLDKERVTLVCPYCGNREPLDPVTASRLNSIDARDAAFGHADALKTAYRADAQKRKEKSARRSKRITIFVVVIVAFFALTTLSVVIDDAMFEYNQSKKLTNTYEWPSVGLSQQIPKPTQENGTIEYDSASRFEIEVPCDSASDFSAYIERCKEKGFTVDEDGNSSMYKAYNAEGYCLTVYFWSFNTSMDIELEAPRTFSALIWPHNGLGALAPAPESTVGAIDNDTPTSFHAYVAETPLSVYTEYVAQCMENGFDQGYNRSTKDFYAENADGVRITVTYEGYEIMNVRIYEPSR